MSSQSAEAGRFATPTAPRPASAVAVPWTRTLPSDKVLANAHIGDERPLDLRPALVAFVVERPRHRGAGLPFAQSGKSVAVSCQDLIAGGDSSVIFPRRRSAIEAIIGHMKNEGHLGRCYLKGRTGDAANVILTAVGYNLHLVVAWLKALFPLILNASSSLKSAC